MRLEFTYTPQDLEEMAKGSAAQTSKRGGDDVSGFLNPLQRNLIGWIIFIALAIALFVLMRGRASSSPGAPPPALPPAANSGGLLRIVVPIVPWLLIFGFIWFFVFRQMRKHGPQQVWERSASLQQPKVLEISNAGVRLSDALVQTEWRWESFTGLVETANLFLLRKADNTMVIVPKRAVPPGQIDGLRSELLGRIPAAGLPSRGN